MIALAAAALLANALLLPRTGLGRALARPGEGRWNGVVAYPLAVLLLLVLFPLEAAVAAWAILAVGDPMAALAGRRHGAGARIPWNPRKSVAGSLAYLVHGGLAAAAVTVLALPEVFGVPRGRLLAEPDGALLYAGWIAAGAFAGAAAESLDLGPDDNLPAALAAGGALALLAP
jgi:dolichol kinase